MSQARKFIRNREARGASYAGTQSWVIALLLVASTALARECNAADEAKDKLPPPEDVSFKTADGVTIAATFYPSPSKQGRKTVPVILLHAWKGNRGDFEALALKLQRAGHFVIAPDLRGHGDSSRPAGRVGELRPADYMAIVEPGGDLETIKRFLIAKNNAGELNIEKLCLVGVEMGSVMALNWAARDWSWPPLAVGKQGQDVKALALISPEWSFKGVRINDAVANPNVRGDLSVMIIVGKGNSKLLAEGRRLYSAFEKYHPAPRADAETGSQTLWLTTPQTSLQSTRLLNEKSMHVDEMILKFVELRLAKQQIPWEERRNPLK
jgi:pimeloyl-ACP methyl ester carboxylesterase